MRSRTVTKRRRPLFEQLETRYCLTLPAAPVIIEPLTENEAVSRFDVHMEIDPQQFFDADGDTHAATNWQLRRPPAEGGDVVWQELNSTDPLDRVHIHFGDGTFVGPLANQTALEPNRNYQLVVSIFDSAGEQSATSIRNFRTLGDAAVVPGLGQWIAREGYVVERAATPDSFRLPVNIAFVSNPGPNPTDPFYYVTELYGSIKMVTRNGTVSDYATSLLDYNPNGPISGSGEQGLAGLVVDPATGDLFVTMLWDNGGNPGSTFHFPKVERLHSTDGGRTMATRSVVLNMQPEVQGQSHQISNISIGPDDKLYVHMGDGFDVRTALDLDQYRGKVLRLNKDGTAPTDNPFYNAADGINARDYVYTYGHRNPFGGAWRAANGKHYVVENGNSIDRLVEVTSGQSYGWAGNDQAIIDNSNYNWIPANAPVNIAFVQPSTFNGSLFPATQQDHAYVALSGPTFGSGPQTNGKRIDDFSNLDSRDANGKFTTAPTSLVKYNDYGSASVSALAAGPDGLYFADLYRNDGAGATMIGANVWRIRYVDFHATNFVATSAVGQVTLSWTSNTLASSHRVYRRTVGGTFAPIGTTTGSLYIDNTGVPGSTYEYMVRGVNAGGESEDSNIVAGTPAVGSQEIVVRNGTVNLVDNQTVVGFGSTLRDVPLIKQLEIRNTGRSNLYLQPVTFTGGGANFFSVVTNFTVNQLLAPGASTTLSVKLQANSRGLKSATLVIPNNDADENPFEVKIQGTIQSPEIEVLSGTTNLVDGKAVIDVGSQSRGAVVVRTLTIRNTGNADLILQRPTLSNNGFSFVETTPLLLTVPAGASTSIDVKFNTAVRGPRSTNFVLPNNDGDEGPFNITFKGKVLAPEIDIFDTGVGLVSNSSVLDFGSLLSGTSVTKTITVKNTGDDNLLLQPLVLTGTGFVAVTNFTPGQILAPGSETTITIRFDATLPGDYTGNLLLRNNDGDESRFNIGLKANVTAAIAVPPLKTSKLTTKK